MISWKANLNYTTTVDSEVYSKGSNDKRVSSTHWPLADAAIIPVKLVILLLSISMINILNISLRWRHNGCDGISNHQLTIVYSAVYTGADQRKKSKLRVTGLCGGIHRWPANCPHKWPVTRKILSFDNVIMFQGLFFNTGSGNGLVSPGNKPLPELMLTHVYFAIWRH